MKKIILFALLNISLFISNLFSQGDECSTALQLTNLSNYCSSGGTYTNASGTAGTLGLPSCWTNASQTIDVWFTFVCVGTDAMITVKGSGVSTGATLKEASLALYSGDCSTSLTEHKCSMSTASDNTTSMYQGGMTLGTTYYIRVSTTSGFKGKFDLCINNFNPVQNPNSPNDCDKGTIICNKDAVSVGLLDSYGANTTEHQLPGSCMDSPEANSTWLEFKCSATGTLDFDLSGTNITEDLDWILMEIPAIRNCATKTLVSCNIASCDINGAGSSSNIQRKTGIRAGENAAGLIGGTTTANSEDSGCSSPANGYNNTVNITAGKSYALFINNFTGVQGFTVAWGGTSKFQGPEPAITTDKTVICIGESIQASGATSTAGTYTSLDWTMPSVGVPTSYTGAGPFAVTFNKTGTYPLILKGTDAQGCINVVNKNITVNGLNADFSAPSVCVGSATTFTCPIAGLASYAWNYGDGANGTGVTSSHTYASAGDYTSTLTVSGGGCTNIFTHSVSVLGAALTINPASPNICPGNSTTLNATATVTGNVSKSKSFSQNTSVTVPGELVSTSWDGSLGNTGNSAPATDVGISSIVVSGLSTTNWSINSICMNITSAKPKYNMVYIETPCGQRIKLVDMALSGSGTNFTNTCFTTAGVNIIGSAGFTTAPFTGTYKADEFALWNTNLLGCSNPNGTWKLLVAEYEFASGVNSSITNWTIDFQTDVPNTLKTLLWSPTTNLSSINYTGVSTASGTAASTTSTAETLTLTATDENNCVSTKNVTIIVGGPAAPTVANVAYCQNDVATQLTATAAGSLLWYTAAAGGVGSATAPTPVTTVAGTVSYWVTQTSGGCESTRAKIDVVVSATPSLTITNPATVCSPLSVDITAAGVTAGSTGSGTLTYWTTNAATIAIVTPTAITTSGTYYIKSANGTCTDIKPVTVTVNNCACPVVLTITDPIAVCSPTTIDLTAPAVTAGSSSGTTITYWTDALATSALATSSAVTTSGTYYIKSDDGTCNVIKAVNVTINTKPNLTITNPTPVCSPLTIDITLAGVTTGSTGGGTLSYWSDNACTAAINTPSAIATSGTYYIKSTNGTCTDSKSVVVTINTTPVLTITDPNGACPPSTVDITAAGVTAGSTGGGTLTYWSDNACTSAIATPSAIASSGTYYIKSTNATCTDSKPVTVTIAAPVLSITNPSAVCSPLTVDITLAAVTTGSTGNGVLSYWTDALATSALATPTATTSGTFYIKSTSGICSDIKPVTVTVNATPNLVITDPGAICSPLTIDITTAGTTAGSTGGGTLSYWTDNSASISLATPAAITASGTYYIKALSGSCYDIKPVSVIINTTPSLTITNPTAVCSPSTVDITNASVTAGSTGGGVLTYWSDNAASNAYATPSTATAGTYYIKATSGICFDIKPVTTTVNTTPSLTITNPTTVCSPLTIDITVANVTAGSTGGGTLSYWTDLAATTPLANSTAITTSATYYIKALNGSCSDVKPVVITVTPTPSITVTNPLAVCDPSTVNITTSGIVNVSSGAVPPLTYWNDAAATLSLTNPATVATPGVYYMKATNGNCTDIQPVTVTINTTPNLVITNPSAVCSPLTVDITGAAVTVGSTGGGTLSYWTDNAGSINLASPTAIPTTGNYYIKSTLGNCFDIKSVTATVNITPALTITDPSAVCDPMKADITSSSVTAGSSGGGTLSYWADIAATTPQNTPNAIATSGTYYIKAMSNNCFDIKAVNVTVNIPPTLVIANPSPVCEPYTVDLTDPTIISGSTPGATISYFSNLAGTNNLLTPAYIGYTGLYYIQSTLNGCSTINQVQVIVHPKPVANFIANPTEVTTVAPICKFTNTSAGAISYNWIFNDGGVSGEVNPSHTFPGVEQSKETVILIATSDKGCKDTTIQIINVNEEVLFFIPNTFTPDLDQFNQTFLPIITSGIDLSSYHFTIFNRWGEIVFESYDINYGWEGKLGKDGKDVQEGVYTWKIQYKIKANDSHKVKLGDVVLLK